MTLTARLFACILVASTAMQAQQPAADPAPKVIQMVNVRAELLYGLDAQSSRKGDPVSVRLLDAAKLNDGTAVTKGEILRGQIDDAVPLADGSEAAITLTLHTLRDKSGHERAVKTAILHVKIEGSSPVNPLSKVSDNPGFVLTTLPGGIPQKPQGMSSVSTPPEYTDVAGLSVIASLEDKTSATLRMKRRDLKLDVGTTRLEIGIAVLPEGAVFAEKPMISRTDITSPADKQQNTP